MAGFVIGGQSHAYAFGLPSVAPDAAIDIVKIADDLDGVVGGWPRPEAYWDRLAQAGAGRIVLLSWFGSEPVARYVFAGDPPVDFLLNSHPELPVQPDHALVPEAMVRSTFSIHGKALGDVLCKLKAAVAGVVLLCPTLPKGVSEAALQQMRQHKYFTDLIEAAGGEHCVTLVKAPVLKKFWLLQRDMQKEAAAAHGAVLWDVPAWSQAEDGFLKREFWKNDFTHANRLYGSKVFEEIRHAAASLFETS